MDINLYIPALKSIWFSFTGYLLTMLLYFMPLEGLVISISIAFIINFAAGIIAGIVVQREHVDIKKALYAFIEVAVYLVILTCFFTIGDKMKGDIAAFKALSMLTWAWIYFYAANFSKNMKRLFPHSRGFSFTFYVLNLEFIKSIPYLKNFEEHEKRNT